MCEVRVEEEEEEEEEEKEEEEEEEGDVFAANVDTLSGVDTASSTSVHYYMIATRTTLRVAHILQSSQSLTRTHA
jgi:hypothetical protein